MPNLLDFAKANNFQVTSGYSRGGHNQRSKHYQGTADDPGAIDIDHRGVDFNRLLDLASRGGYTVHDERTRPKGQAVWGGPHFHLEKNGAPKTMAKPAVKKQNPLALLARRPGVIDNTPLVPTGMEGNPLVPAPQPTVLTPNPITGEMDYTPVPASMGPAATMPRDYVQDFQDMVASREARAGNLYDDRINKFKESYQNSETSEKPKFSAGRALAMLALGGLGAALGGAQGAGFGAALPAVLYGGKQQNYQTNLAAYKKRLGELEDARTKAIIDAPTGVGTIATGIGSLATAGKTAVESQYAPMKAIADLRKAMADQGYTEAQTNKVLAEIPWIGKKAQSDINKTNADTNLTNVTAGLKPQEFDETKRRNRVTEGQKDEELNQGGTRIGIAQGQLGVAQDRLAYDKTKQNAPKPLDAKEIEKLYGLVELLKQAEQGTSGFPATGWGATPPNPQQAQNISALIKAMGVDPDQFHVGRQSPGSAGSGYKSTAGKAAAAKLGL